MMRLAAAEAHRLSLSGLLYGAIAASAVGFIAYFTIFSIS
jgi:hypothetical protein